MTSCVAGIIGLGLPRAPSSSSMDEDAGRGKLYSPGHGIQVVEKKKRRRSMHEEDEEARGMKRNLGAIKDRLLEKLSAASVPADALENVRRFLETVVRDVRVAAHGLTIDALTRIKSHLFEFIPSLSPALATKMVEDVEKETSKEEEGDHSHEQQQQQHRVGGNNKKSVSIISPASSLFASFIKPLSRL